MLDDVRTGEPIPVTVIGGYLGAGKTTLLNAVLGRPGGRRIGVVVNDFGVLGVDAGLVRSHAGDSPVVNLANGCVCCTLGDDLGSTLRTLADIEPRLDHILVEASGVADPASVAAWGTVPPFAPGGVVVAAAADSVRRSARDRYVGNEVLRQLGGADLIIVTKVDTVEDEHVSDVRIWLRSLSDAPIIESAKGDVDPDVVLGPMHSRVGVVDPIVGDDEASTHDAANYVRWAWVSAEAVDASQLDEFIALLPAGLLRLKGVLRVVGDSGAERRLIQVVGRTSSIGPAPSSTPLGLEAIGSAGVLDIAGLEARAVRYLQRR